MMAKQKKFNKIILNNKKASKKVTMTFMLVIQLAIKNKLKT